MRRDIQSCLKLWTVDISWKAAATRRRHSSRVLPLPIWYSSHYYPWLSGHASPTKNTLISRYIYIIDLYHRISHRTDQWPCPDALKGDIIMSYLGINPCFPQCWYVAVALWEVVRNSLREKIRNIRIISELSTQIFNTNTILEIKNGCSLVISRQS